MNDFRVLQIDHVELFVPDRHEAAGWYQRMLGFEILAGYQAWAEHPRGPLMISTDAGATKLALFEGTPQESQATAGFHRVAFRVNADGFLQFLGTLASNRLKNDRGAPVTPDAAVDHATAFSVYFCDPFGHRLEVTTYEHEAVRAALARRSR